MYYIYILYNDKDNVVRENHKCIIYIYIYKFRFYSTYTKWCITSDHITLLLFVEDHKLINSEMCVSNIISIWLHH